MIKTRGAKTQLGANAIHCCGWLLHEHIFLSKTFADAILLQISILDLDFWPHVDWYIIKRWLRQEALKHSWGLTPFIAVADCCMSIYSYPKLSPTRYSSKFQYWTLIFWSCVDWYIIKRWPKREAIKRRGGELSINIVADWRMCTFSHPKILRQRSSFRLQYWTLKFE